MLTNEYKLKTIYLFALVLQLTSNLGVDARPGQDLGLVPSASHLWVGGARWKCKFCD